MSESSAKKTPLSLSDTVAGLIGGVMLFFVQKIPEGSDAKHLMIYATPVLALLLNNLFSIVVGYVRYNFVKRKLKSQFQHLSTDLDEYSKNKNPDPDVVLKYNAALKSTQMAIINNTLSALEPALLPEDVAARSSQRRSNSRAKTDQ